MRVSYHNVENATRSGLAVRQVGRWSRAGAAISDPQIVDRFLAKVKKTHGCWLWVGAHGRYGQFQLEGEPHGKIYAHRASYQIHVGSIPRDVHVLHTCDVRECVNPAHLFLGTHLDNMRDAATKGRLHAPRPSGRKVTDEQVAEMVALRAAGALLADIAAQYGVTKAFVSQVVRGLRRRAA